METLEEVLKKARKSGDFIEETERSKSGQVMQIYYFQSMVDMQKIGPRVFWAIKQLEVFTYDLVKNALYTANIQHCRDAEHADLELLRGSLLLRFIAGGKPCNLLVDLAYQEDREITVPEIEFSVFGSKESFIETVEVNINLLRRRIPSTDLYMKKFTVGSGSKTSVYVVYCHSIANAENVQTVIQRITDLQLDQLPDSSTLLQVLEDSSSVFPQIKIYRKARSNCFSFNGREKLIQLDLVLVKSNEKG
ncbi:spore germination protein [Shouchella patagoniensis]|uniref:spore germination protein n=1 Tax=Shouchella patagoniensis TaxID=228576 RepID=UPI000995D1CB|nr:spore germination protein [Shouchella patagoniensis]